MTATNIFVNLPVADLDRSKAFYTALGCELNPDFTDENAACVVWDDNIFFMVLRRDFFETFTSKQVADAAVTAQVGLSFSRISREEVDEIAERAVAAGGSEPRPAQDLGFMYSRDIVDPDGHELGFLFMPDGAVEED